MKKILDFISELFIFSIIVFFSILLVSCKKKEMTQIPSNIPETTARHNWYYFSDNNFVKISKPALAPSVVEKPWTEAVRISSTGLESSQNFETPKGYAIVNRSGVLVFKGKEVKLCPDTEIFNGRTAGNLVFAQGVPIFSVYKSTFFNETKNAVQFSHPFLIQFNSEQSVFYPIINVENLGLEKNSEINDFIFDGQFWTCSVKKSTPEKIDFSYLTFQPKENISLITPYNAEKLIHVSEVNMKSFRQAKKFQDFSKAPERLKDLLKTIPTKVNFSVSVSTASGHSARNYIRSTKKNAETEDLTANAIISDTWIACLFRDGTLYLNGALFEHHTLNNGSTLGIRLPKLPVNFVYGDFVISGTMLYSSWEEAAFYKTKRSGFISVDLEEILYRK